MKAKWMKTIAAGAVFSMLCAGTAFAGAWLKGQGENQDRWWYGNEDGTFANNGWYWIDGNNDGVAENYCFDSEGWLYVGVTTPDGYVVNENGALVSEGQVMTQNVEVPAAAPTMDAAVASLDGVYKYYGQRYDNGNVSLAPDDPNAMGPKSITVTAIDNNTIHLVRVATYPASPEGTFVLKKNGDVFVLDSYIGSDNHGMFGNRSVYVQEVRFDGNRVEVGGFNPVVGRMAMFEIYER